jgi:hypothetical protein
MPTRKLTDLFAERVQPPAKGRIEYFDATFGGLSLRVTAQGNKSWSLFYRTGGRLRRLTIGQFPAIRPAQARREAGAALERVRLGIDPAGEATVTNNGGVLTDDNDHQQIDRAAAEPAAGSISYPGDGLSWDRPGPDVDRPGLVRRRAGTHRQLRAVALDRTPHFDAAGRFIHACFNCGCEAIFGT